VVGLGMNEFELGSKNNILDSYDVKDLNVDAAFPYDDASFTPIRSHVSSVSTTSLTKPRQVFQEIGRVLKPGGMAMIAISNRCFPTKAWNLWLRTNDLEHVFIVGSFFHFTMGVFEDPSCVDVSPNPGRSDPMFIIKGVKKVSVASDIVDADDDADAADIDVASSSDDKAEPKAEATTPNAAGETKDISSKDVADAGIDNENETLTKRRMSWNFLRIKEPLEKCKTSAKQRVSMRDRRIRVWKISRHSRL
jgi:SAM-dependent methyltransferase